ncbi:TIGR02444 family protein [Halomonas alkaliantarctica]|nr:TIGR02444 family protein [Halomonas alkaliantarctica]
MRDSTRLTALKQNPLWDFALDFYTRPGVEHACLCLQDEAKVDVCELLLHAWLFHHGRKAEHAALVLERRTRVRWQQEITGVLRQLRRELKGAAQASEGVAELRATIKRAELLAERENLQRWQQWALVPENTRTDPKETTREPSKRAHWLQLQLFSPNFHPFSGSGCAPIPRVENAWEVLGGQLDRFIPAR